MTDPGVVYADKKLKSLENEIKKIYKQAQDDIDEEISAFTKAAAAKEKALQAKVNAGKMSQDAFDQWKAGSVFQSDVWAKKRAQIANVLTHANTIATQIINGEKPSIFAYNGNYAAYDLEHGAGVSFGFDLYSEAAVENLIKNHPKILPPKKINTPTDKRWVTKTIDSQVAQGIINGESIPQITARMQNVTGRSENSSRMYARTAVTSAQNAGRQYRYQEAEDLGIKFKKVWIASLDGRTRDLHADLDGEAVDPDEDFEIDGYAVAYPGDPWGEPEMVYNCRCSMGTELVDYPSKFSRHDNESGEMIEDTTYNEWYIDKATQNMPEKVKDLSKLESKIQKEMTKMDPNGHAISGIWKNQTVTYADYPDKAASIQAKRDYFNDQLSKLPPGADRSEIEKKLAQLDDFEKNGKKYADYAQKLQNTQAEIIKKTPAAKANMTQAASKSKFGPDAYTQERKDKAVWAKDPRSADRILRGKCGEVWRGASNGEKDAAFDYTISYSKFNEPLRGIEYGTNRYLGVGRTDLNAGSKRNGRQLNMLTDLIERSSYKEDIWLQRMCNYDGMDKFLGIDENLLLNGTEAQLQRQLLGKTVTEYGFMSCGSSRGTGLGMHKPILLNIYAPSGTKMLYCEPFSNYGNGDGRNWDGVSGQRSFGTELETLLQQGTEFRIAKVERSDKIYIDLEVISQDHVQRWTP